jgi:23S rRNA (cytosine1962-C5)-methyltransferase
MLGGPTFVRSDWLERQPAPGPSLRRQRRPGTVGGMKQGGLPRVAVTSKGAARLRAGEPWAWRSDVSRPAGAAGDGGAGAEEADVVMVVDPRGTPLGTAFFAPASQIPLRLWDPAGAQYTDAELRRRLAAAHERRRALAGAAEAYRLVHAEADRLPGLIVDRYADAVVVQTLCAAMDRREAAVVAALRDLLAPRLIVARDDGAARDFEGLPRRRGVLHGGAPTQVTYREGDVSFTVDLLEDAKTGGFLDQRENHLRARAFARGAALDAFTYHGGFALQLARGCDSVLAFDESAAAVDRARANATQNGLRNVECRVANAFDVLPRLEAAGERFDVVALDPPALAKRRGALTAAERGYRELNLRGLRLLRPGGVLITCSCSAQMTPARFEAMLAAAAGQAGRAVQVLERRGAAEDHPVLLGVPATEYLKCWILRAL